MTDVKFRFGSFNIQTPLAGRWPERRAGTVRTLKLAACSIIVCQEVDYESAAYIARGLGSGWRYQRHEQNSVFWDGAKWKLLGAEAWDLNDGKDPKVRGLLLCELQSVKSGAKVWAGCTHLSSNTTAGSPELREREAAEVGSILKKYPRSITGVDLNDSGKGTRAALAKYGIQSLRSSLDGFPTIIDDVLTGPAVKPYSAARVRNRYSDHGYGLRVSSRLPAR